MHIMPQRLSNNGFTRWIGFNAYNRQPIAKTHETNNNQQQPLMPFVNPTTNADVADADASVHKCLLYRMSNGEEHAQLHTCTHQFASWGGMAPNGTIPYGDVIS